MSDIVSLTNISKSYTLEEKSDRPVLSGIEFRASKGEFVALVGPSGAGKSTLLHIIGLLDKPNKGTVEYFFDEKKISSSELTSANITEIRNKKIGFVFQFHHLLPEFSALENVMMPSLLAGTSVSKAKEEARELMERVGVGHRLEHKPSELSGGEQQRIAIARALINRPQLLLADEPTGNLDTTNTIAVLDLLKDLRHEYNLTCIVATHSHQVAELADRVLQMKDGKITW